MVCAYSSKVLSRTLYHSLGLTDCRQALPFTIYIWASHLPLPNNRVVAAENAHEYWKKLRPAAADRQKIVKFSDRLLRAMLSSRTRFIIMQLLYYVYMPAISIEFLLFVCFVNRLPRQIRIFNHHSSSGARWGNGLNIYSALFTLPDILSIGTVLFWVLFIHVCFFR